MHWRLDGHRVALEWKPARGLYTASLPSVPGLWASGRSRREALARLGRRLAPEPAESSVPDRQAGGGQRLP